MREQLSKRTKSRSKKAVVRVSRQSALSRSKGAKTASKRQGRSSAPAKAVAAAKKSAKKSKATKAAGAKRSPSKATKAAPKTTKKSAVKAGAKAAVRAKALKKSRQATKAPPEPVRRQVASGVLRAFEQALKVFNRRHFAEAKELFETIRHRYPQEVEIIARTQTYIQICQQKLSRPNASPRDADELYDRGVVALNIGDFTQARALFEKALRLRPDEPHLLYSLAATHAQTGAHDQALDYLNRLIQIQPRYRAQAMNDADFSELHADKRFLEIIGVSSPFDLLEARR